MFSSALLFAFGLSLSLTVKAATAGPWQQCGGITYKGPIECDPGWVCTYQNSYYSQCIPGGTTKATTSTPTSTRSSSSTSRTTTTTQCPYAIARATGTPIGAITEGTPFYGYYLQRDSTTNEAVLIPDPFAPQISYGTSIYRLEYISANATCISRVYLHITASPSSSPSYKQIYWLPNNALTFSWKSDPNQVLQTVTTNNGYSLNWGDHDWFLACFQGGKWKVYLQTGSDAPAGVTCVATQLKLGLVVAE
ncbi:carbohydrate-binding module family 1 protein [Tulasnella calospora MUT 4182]|uniref:Carbohydrate-binding module family 1 protein n=1 Tax=Tulasnella calospora MUT 4182 TaxID=1051891 RepID=A0A0C3Q8D7_9AGAM|nr:carbohydrate-binding module family 1 protein [Tulasnella calospora MUT 4182]